MKTLILSSSQFDKLQEMLNTLYFEEEKRISIYSPFNINWYEFTIRFLSQKIFNQLSVVEDSNEISPLKLCSYQDDFGRALLMQDVHPIDYLYELYKEIK